MKSQDVQDYGKIITKTVYDFIKLHGIKRSVIADDLIQMCWIKILEYKTRENKLPDWSLAKKICSDTLKDFVDYSQRRSNYTSYDDLEDTENLATSTDSNQDDAVMINELKNMFEKGSPERTYIEFYLSKAGLSGDIIPNKTRQEDGFTEGNLAKMLGFPSASSSRYRKFRSRMQEIIKDYFGDN